MGLCVGKWGPARGVANFLYVFLGTGIGSALFVALFPKLENGIMAWKSFGNPTFPELLKAPAWVVVVSFAAGIAGFLYWLESAGY